LTKKGILKIKGIKCYNPKCDYENETILPQEYQFWVNKPCPKCGEIIFTQNDFNLYKFLIATISIANKIPSRQDASLFSNTGKIYNPKSKKKR